MGGNSRRNDLHLYHQVPIGWALSGKCQRIRNLPRFRGRRNRGKLEIKKYRDGGILWPPDHHFHRF